MRVNSRRHVAGYGQESIMKKLIPVVLALILIAGAWRWYAPVSGWSGGIANREAHALDRGGASAPVGSDQDLPGVSAETFEADRAADGAAWSPFAILAAAKRASEAFAKLLPLAESGDAAALLAVSQLVSDCQFLFHPQHYSLKAPPVGTPQHGAWQAARNRRQDFCDAPAEHRRAMDEVLADFQEKLELAAARGDELALVALLGNVGNIEDAAAVVEGVLDIVGNTKEPEVLREAVRLLAASADSRVKAIENRVFDDLQGRGERDLVIFYAGEWMACANGASNCAPYSREADSQCIFSGECFSHMSRFDYIRSRALSGRQFEQMHRYLELLKDELLPRR